MTRIRICAVLAAAAAAGVLGRFPIAAAAQQDRLFSSDEPIKLTLAAPLSDLMAHAQDHSNRVVNGTLTYVEGGREMTIDHVGVSVRGHTSRSDSECTFPKLKLQIPVSERRGLFSRGSVKLGTHCGDSNGRTLTHDGRLLNEAAAHREAFVYRLLSALQVPTLKARPARVTYIDGTAPVGTAGGGQRPLERDAFLLEDDDDAVKRLGGTKQINEDSFTSASERFTPRDTATVMFAEALIGNFDWCLRMTPRDGYRCDGRHPLWNVLAIAASGGTATPLIYDFDVSGMVAGGHQWFGRVYNEAFVSSKSHPAVEVLGQVQRTRSVLPRQVLDEARARFTARKREAYGALSAAAIDDGGRRLAREYMDAFFDAIGSDDAFYRPAVVAPDTAVYADSSRNHAVCGQRSVAPIGTVVSDPLEKADGMMRVVLLDTLWHWGPPVQCADVHEGAVWIAADAVGRDYPR